MSITFTDNAEQELKQLADELQLVPIVKYMSNNKEIPEEFQKLVVGMVDTLSDMFGSGIPVVSSDPIHTLRVASRDINLSKVLRERGIVRLYMMAKSYTDVEIPSLDGGTETVQVKTYQTLINPDSERGENFGTQEDFLGWFCRSAHVSRALVFMRFAAYDRLMKLEYSLEEAFKILITKPSVITRTIEKLASYNKDGSIKEIDPEVARSMAKKVLTGEEQDYLLELAERVIEEGNPEDILDMYDASIPAIRKILEEVAMHDSARDAGEMVEVDILNAPEISYGWDHGIGGLAIQMIKKGYDENDDQYISSIYNTILLPDTMDELPKEILDDLVRRIPIRSFSGIDD